MRRFVGTPEVALRLGISTDRVVQKIEDGTIKAIRPMPGGQYRIRIEEVERLEQEAERRVAG
jgi:excisionase family DNA binding protein